MTKTQAHIYNVCCLVNGIRHNIALAATSKRHAAIRVINKFHSSQVKILAIVSGF